MQLLSYISEMFTLENIWFVISLIIQIAILLYLVAWSWQRIVGSQAERLVKGVLIIAGIWGLAWLIKFEIITSLLSLVVPAAFIALVVIFQPELRRWLSHLGQVQSLKMDWSLEDAEEAKFKRDVGHIIAAVRELSRSKTGALIVIEPLLGERDYVSPGTTVNADISTTLLLTIFFPKSPLHDGAVVIRKNKVVAAGVILPMTDDPELSYRYGTRHRAAIGLSETYDGLCIVVSEETGAISAASRGMLARYKTADDLMEPIQYLYTQGGDSKDPTPVNNFLSLFTKRKDGPEDTKAEVGSESSATDTSVAEEAESKLKDKDESDEDKTATEFDDSTSDEPDSAGTVGVGKT